MALLSNYSWYDHSYPSCFDERSCLAVLWYLPTLEQIIMITEALRYIWFITRPITISPNLNAPEIRAKCPPDEFPALILQALIQLETSDLDVIQKLMPLDDFRIL